MILATQYYRPPFPEQKYWKDDLARMRDAGLNGVQLWACWGWIEPKPGEFIFDDYDQLVAEAARIGLGVIISTIAEIQPFWILREIPDATMVDNFGHKVISSCRGECNVGLTPGGCTDNAALRDRMRRFLEETTGRYAAEKHLLGWDIWNETRWCVNADAPVCYCPSTLAAFRRWLDERHGGLEGLNAAWKRRYCSWDDVMPGKLPPRPYTDMVEFLRFLAWRARQHVRFRYEAVRSRDTTHLVTAHCGHPATSGLEPPGEQVMCRGNDWELANELDGFGCSHFPCGTMFDDTDYGVRLESTRSAARGKVYWVSELQGGAAQSGLAAMPPIPAAMQQRWVWNGIARGAKATIFWCWRDEVFGSESSGYGLTGNDGYAPERLEAMRRTGDILQKHGQLLESYVPDDAAVGVLFEPDSYFLDWAQFGGAQRAAGGLRGYCYALEELSIPYEIVESEHLAILDSLSVLFMPWSLVVKQETARRLREFVEAGGTLLVEAETDAFTSLGFYRYPGQDRTFASAIGAVDMGRRLIDEDRFAVTMKGRTLELLCDGWHTPLVAGDAEVLARRRDGSALVLRRSQGAGTVYVVGTFLGNRYYREHYPGFESFVGEVVRSAGAGGGITVGADPKDGRILWRSGSAGDRRLLFVINFGQERELTVEVPARLLPAGSSVTLLGGPDELPLSVAGDRAFFKAPVAQGATAVFCWQMD